MTTAPFTHLFRSFEGTPLLIRFLPRKATKSVTSDTSGIKRNLNVECRAARSANKIYLTACLNAVGDVRCRFAIALTAFHFSFISVSNSFVPPPAFAINPNNLLFLEAWRAVDKAYVDKTFNGVAWFKYREDIIKKSKMDSVEETYAAIRVMLARLDDPYTRFLEPEKYSSLSDSTLSANITGIGVELAYSSDEYRRVIVVAPTPGGPADQVGVKPSDIVVAINGESVTGLSLYEVADRLQGPANSEIVLSLARNYDAEGDMMTNVRTVRVMRRRYTLVPVQSKLCVPFSQTGKTVGYIRLTAFNQLSAVKMKEAIEQGIFEGADEFVVDLRRNPGGLFPGAIEIAKMFINDGVIVYIADSEGVRDVFEADNTSIAPDVPLTLLVDRGTASASEVLAGALQDNGRARVLGEPTFGKGLIQTVVPLSDGSAVSVTVARYQTPSGSDINKIGILPDAPSPSVSVQDHGNKSFNDLPMSPDKFCSALAEDPTIETKLFL
jgi:C-terminal peptidase prc|tara:strand:+ start:637 stop:2124 length:1488 start_codon:yes stop_codon:yes gene_type:complete